ncbi:hypothetical protein PGB90_000895 [Kerria lacca]
MVLESGIFSSTSILSTSLSNILRISLDDDGNGNSGVREIFTCSPGPSTFSLLSIRTADAPLFKFFLISTTGSQSSKFFSRFTIDIKTLSLTGFRIDRFSHLALPHTRLSSLYSFVQFTSLYSASTLFSL